MKLQELISTIKGISEGKFFIEIVDKYGNEIDKTKHPIEEFNDTEVIQWMAGGSRPDDHLIGRVNTIRATIDYEPSAEDIEYHKYQIQYQEICVDFYTVFAKNEEEAKLSFQEKLMTREFKMPSEDSRNVISSEITECTRIT